MANDVLRLRQGWTRQPQYPRPIDWGNPLTRGLRRAVSFIPSAVFDSAENKQITYYSRAFVPGPLGMGLYATTGSQQGCSLPVWSNVTSEASILLVQQRASTGNNNWLEVGGNTNQDHFGFSNLVYTDAFWSTRWMSGVSFPAGKTITNPHVVVLTVKSGEQKAYYDGSLWSSNTLSGGFTIPSFFLLSASEQSSRLGFDGITYAVLMFDRVLSQEDVASLSANPWQIFAP